MPQNPNNLCWLDMEMTGLDPERERIIEVAMIITDPDLNVLAQSEVYAIHQSDEVLGAMDDWNTATHGRTGLTERVRASKHTEAEVEQKLLAFMAEWVPEKTTPMSATPFVKTAALWCATCLRSRPISIIATLMCPP